MVPGGSESGCGATTRSVVCSSTGGSASAAWSPVWALAFLVIEVAASGSRIRIDADRFSATVNSFTVCGNTVSFDRVSEQFTSYSFTTAVAAEVIRKFVPYAGTTARTRDPFPHHH